MAEDDRPACLICGQRFRSVGHHVLRAHGISLAEYRDQHGIRRSASLASPSTRAVFQDKMARQIAAGKLDAHYAANAERAAVAARAATATLRQMRAAGVDLPHGTPATSREVLEAIVIDIEAGAIIATAVKHSPIGTSAFHEGMKRHPDLRVRVDEARQRRRGEAEVH